ncbi:MAG: ATP-dependent zinc metalloprotease FtsH [Candidatus Celerinatantimonas neptuna]|nr:MAG: ATP-dependent zinc metalloprotease FtsH [Candidatus Celerinatantimonas neptuna]
MNAQQPSQPFSLNAQQTLTTMHANILTLQREIDWFSQILDRRIKLYFEQDSALDEVDKLSAPDLSSDRSPYATFILEQQFTSIERLILILALLPHLRPQLLDIFFTQNESFNRGYSEFGGIQGKNHSGFIPTGETAAFLWAGDNLTKRIEFLAQLPFDHRLFQQNIIILGTQEPDEPFLSCSLSISSDYLHRLTTLKEQTPGYSRFFPAKRIETPLEWDDLILSPSTLNEIQKIRTWLTDSQTIIQRWQLQRHLKAGYRCLFYGPPGTGKTLTATLLGKSCQLPVYRVDLSAIVSKYIGETEKNLANLFDQAQNRRWILFFDEADALFGTRSQGSSANDRHANQQVAYLLQRVEDFPGMVILATNLKDNIDDAFARRFQSMIYFPTPDIDQRLTLWQSLIGDHLPHDEQDQLRQIAESFPMAAGAMINVIRDAAIHAFLQQSPCITCDMLRQGIQKERRKEGKTL